MKRVTIGQVVSVALLTLSCQQQSVDIDVASIEHAVGEILRRQVLAWNDADIEGFLDGYARSEKLRFASGGQVYYGRESLLQRYRERYPDKATMGTLSFGDVDVRVLAPTAALVFGKWQLARENDVPYGYFTLLFQKTAEGWKIVHDHTSIAD